VERGRYSLCLRLVRLVEAVRTGFQQPSGPGAEVGTAQSRHGGSRQAGAWGWRHAEGSDTQPDGGWVAQRLLVL
jgi:hypothetical protein